MKTHAHTDQGIENIRSFCSYSLSVQIVYIALVESKSNMSSKERERNETFEHFYKASDG